VIPGPLPRFFTDRMLGRLTRYPRMAGYDTAEVRGASDREIVERARFEGRRLLTRDRRLAVQVPEAILLTEIEISRQVLELHRLCPGLQWKLRPLRCTLCNGSLARVADSDRDTIMAPERLRRSGEPIWRCRACGQCYWVGSHSARVASDLARWTGEGYP
jgi:uncharacterized protein with PIN domain